MLLFTSLSPSPSREQAQKDAISTWRATGHVPVAVQHPSDDVSAYGEMNVVILRTENTTPLGRKNYVRLDAILKLANEICLGRIGIINADCALTCGQNHIETIADPKALSIFSRTDVDPDGENPKVFPWGFDLFVMDPALMAPLVPGSSMALGLPWWDYMLPMAAINNSIPVMRHDNILRHVRHEERYEYAGYLMQASAIERALGIALNSRHTILPIINHNTTLVHHD